MATKLNEINLTNFWQDEVTNYINKILAKQENKYLLNLTSQEYSSVINLNIKCFKLLTLIKN